MTAEDRKLAIVQAALPLFARKGFAQTTTKELAKAAGVSEPILYRHFPSKDALYLEIQDFSCRDTDPAVKRLSDLKPSTATLFELVYYLMRILVLGLPKSSTLEWDTRQRLMINSFLEDGTYARLLYRNRFDQFCEKMETCLDAAIAAGDAVKSPLTRGNRSRLAYHVGAWIALVQLPGEAALDFKVSREELLDEAVWFALRGMGITDRALTTHYNPAALAQSLAEDGLNTL